MNSMEHTDRQAVKAKQQPATPQGRRPGRPTLSNEELLDKALDLFLEQGFERTSIDAIAASAGMAKRTIYLRYGDKESLFRAALERAIEEWIIPIEQLRAAECDDLEKTLLEVGRILVTNIMRPEGLRLLRITNAESARMPEIGAYTYRHGTGRTIAYLADLFRRRIGPDSVSMNEWQEAAFAFLYLVVCGPPTITAWGVKLDEEKINSHTSYCVRLFLYGMLERHVTSPGDPAFSQAESGAAESASQLLMAGAFDSPATADLQELQHENRRLREMLLESMLEVASIRELREDSRGSSE